MWWCVVFEDGLCLVCGDQEKERARALRDGIKIPLGGAEFMDASGNNPAWDQQGFVGWWGCRFACDSVFQRGNGGQWGESCPSRCSRPRILQAASRWPPAVRPHNPLLRAYSAPLPSDSLDLIRS